MKKFVSVLTATLLLINSTTQTHPLRPALTQIRPIATVLQKRMISDSANNCYKPLHDFIVKIYQDNGFNHHHRVKTVLAEHNYKAAIAIIEQEMIDQKVEIQLKTEKINTTLFTINVLLNACYMVATAEEKAYSKDITVLKHSRHDDEEIKL